MRFKLPPLAKKWMVRSALILLLPVAGGLVSIIYVTGKIAIYEQADNAARMASKAAYLKSISGPDPANAPDLVVILFDDLGYGDVGFTGNRLINTPHMDALAANGMVL